MSITTHKFNPMNLVMMFFMITTITTPINCLITRKLDDTTVPTSPDSGIKCGSCPACNNPCNQSPPPPPPSPPLPPPPPPPPPKKQKNCPPPPPSQFIYITGPPGNLYPIDTYYGGAGRSFAVDLALLIGCGIVGLVSFWWTLW
ncbi:hypothetical protein LOK49_LG03G00924 [Camellia lanceoleosa]|uniref:Uncharacterized protein n=1 Tax=Camellia lanceoleosa TaxID=1840588 RepID=A0ACC0IAI0_9ERIC|nr:hypothetical protein LOK49_LG03G00924 [Camellia lanceoleosa]